jgi:hypothetical protein
MKEETIVSKSMIQLVNQFDQNVDEGGVIDPGSVVRRYGCNLGLVGKSIGAVGSGYYEILATVTVTPTDVGVVTVAGLNGDEAIPGLTGSMYAETAAQPVTIPLVGTERLFCECGGNGRGNFTFVLEAGAGVVNNVSINVKKL